MKRGTPSHPKVLDLATKLDVPIYSAVGLLEMLWHFTDEYAIQSDIGKYPDPVIAKAVGWPPSESERLIKSLIECRWVDLCSKHRLLIHDWDDHCNDYCRKRLTRLGLAVYCVSGKVRTNTGQSPELSISPRRGAARRGEGVAREESGKVQTESGKVQTENPLLGEVSEAFDRHLKFSRKEPRDLVVQNFISMNGKFDWDKFRKNHKPYCEHYDSHGWDFCRLSFMEWVHAGMPPPPPERKKGKFPNESDQKSSYKPLPTYEPPKD